MRKYNIFIIDDHKIVRAGIKALLFGHSKISITGEGNNGDELLILLKKQVPDLIIMDISLPGKSGIELTSFLNQNYPEVKILILTSNCDEDSIIKSIQSGANGFLHKDSSQEELTSAIELIMEGDGYFSENISKIIYKSYISKIKENASIELTNSKNLTDRELQIIKLFSEGLSYKEIANILNISTKTVEAHKVNILNKLELKNTIELVKYAIKNKIISL